MKILAALIILSISSVAAATPSEISLAEIGTQTGGMPTGADWATWGIGVVHSYQELQDSFHALHASDASCIDTTGAGAPATPSSCMNDSPYVPGVAGGAPGGACGECFNRATRSLNTMRLNLERLRCTYTSYARWINAKIAFGDSASGIHAVTGLAWQSARGEITASFNRLKATYDKKYADMMPNLRSALDALGKCEEQYFHEPDWYDRFGFIYYTFMADRYKRAD